MNRLFKYSLPFLSLFLLLQICLSSCENDIAVVNSVTASVEKQLPVEAGKNVEIIYSDSAQMRAKLTAPVLNRYAGKKNFMELPKGLNVVFYDDKKSEQTKLTADYGIGFDNGNGIEHMEAKRNVVVINQKGDRLNTENLIWNALSKKIYTDEFVKITTKDEVIWGDGMVADQDFSNYTITNVKGNIPIKDEVKDSAKINSTSSPKK
jgi:LPS export ABC transporter protein LptC